MIVSHCTQVGAGWARNKWLSHTMAPALRRMHEAGVRLVAGSDAGAIPGLAHHRLADGMVVMARCAELSHAQALRSATSEAAAALGLSDTCGALLEGLSADMILVRGNPIVELEVMCLPPLAVVCRGQRVQPCTGGANVEGGGPTSRWYNLRRRTRRSGLRRRIQPEHRSSQRCGRSCRTCCQRHTHLDSSGRRCRSGR